MMAYNPEWREHYVFLEILRQSGKTNMFGATPYLVKHTGLNGITARKVLQSWMDNYDQLLEDGVIPR
tara:strand:+ start:6832 stop:7032 length:201 start_codon:yes stop_codon:yes gene_type:complete